MLAANDASDVVAIDALAFDHALGCLAPLAQPRLNATGDHLRRMAMEQVRLAGHLTTQRPTQAGGHGTVFGRLLRRLAAVGQWYLPATERLDQAKAHVYQPRRVAVAFAERVMETVPGIHDAFVALAERTRALKVGDALQASTDIGPVVDGRQLEQNLAYVASGREHGAKRVCGGEQVENAAGAYLFTPALFTEVTADMRIYREEIFGPVLSVLKVRDYGEAFAAAEDTALGLSAGIVTTSLRHAEHFKRNSSAGMVMVNLPTAGVDYPVPFGGNGASSLGSREQGTDARQFFTRVKTTYQLA